MISTSNAQPIKTGNAIVSELLSGNNYERWRIQMKTYLCGQELWDVVEHDEPDLAKLSEAESKTWNKKNALALHAIQISCEPDIFREIESETSAKTAFAALDPLFSWKQDITPDRENDPLFKAIFLGDWNTALKFLDEHPEAVREKAPESGMTALHIAVTNRERHIVEILVERMTEDDLKIEREDGFTALAAAIEVGDLPIAECLIKKSRGLISIVHEDFRLPVEHAVASGQKHMVHYLYSATPTEDLLHRNEGKDGASLLAVSIFMQHFDIALHLLEQAPLLAITNDVPGKSPVFALAQSKVFLSGSSLSYWQHWIYRCIRIPDSATNHIYINNQYTEDGQSDELKSSETNSLSIFSCLKKVLVSQSRRGWSYVLEFLGIKRIYRMKLIHVQSNKILKHMCEAIKNSDETQIRKGGVQDALLDAANEGNIEFIKSIAKANPILVWTNYVPVRVFEIAVDHHQAEIFSLIYGLPDKMAIVNYWDENGSNMLHKAAALAPSEVLKRIPGAALQMQRELQWFKEVERLASPAAREHTNKQFLKPRALFQENHRDLAIAGEKWMKNTSNSCTVVAAFIVTITFAAAFTFPGGNHQDTGYPIFSEEKLFRVFTMANAVALFTSTTSVLMFLGIRTSHYREEDFLESLPKKLIIGLSTLFLSIAAMIIAFCAGLSQMFHKELWILVPSVCLACIPVASFVRMQFPLLVDIFMSTYGPTIFKRNPECWM